MKAIRLRARGGPEAFAYEEAPQPRPGEGEVLVRVHAAGVNAFVGGLRVREYDDIAAARPPERVHTS